MENKKEKIEKANIMENKKEKIEKANIMENKRISRNT